MGPCSVTKQAHELTTRVRFVQIPPVRVPGDGSAGDLDLVCYISEPHSGPGAGAFQSIPRSSYERSAHRSGSGQRSSHNFTIVQGYSPPSPQQTGSPYAGT